MPDKKYFSTWVLCNSCAKSILRRWRCSWEVTFWSFSVDKVRPTRISPRCLLDLPPSGFWSAYHLSIPDEGMSWKISKIFTVTDFEFIYAIARFQNKQNGRAHQWINKEGPQSKYKNSVNLGTLVNQSVCFWNILQFRKWKINWL